MANKGLIPSDDNGFIQYSYDIDENVFKVASYVWNPNTLAWERMTQPKVEFSGDLTLSMDDVERLLAGYYWTDSRYDYDTDGNAIYKGLNITRNASPSDSTWYITRYDYDIDGNVTRKRVLVGSWTNRAGLSW